MENVSKYPKYDFLNAKAMMEELYDMRIPEDKFLEKAYYAWKELPDRHSDYHVFIEDVNTKNRINLPENVDYILNVTYANYFFYNMFGDASIFLYRNGSRLVYPSSEEWSHYRLDKSKKDNFRQNITYNLHDGYIDFPQGELNGSQIAVLYRGLIVNDDCDPLLYYREIKAIADRVAFYQTRIDVRNNVPGAAELLQYLESSSNRTILRAGIPENVTDNQWDQYLNVSTSFDRKMHNRNYKFRH